MRPITTYRKNRWWCSLNRDTYQGMPLGMPLKHVECAGFSRWAVAGKTPRLKPLRIVPLAASLKLSLIRSFSQTAPLPQKWAPFILRALAAGSRLILI